MVVRMKRRLGLLLMLATPSLLACAEEDLAHEDAPRAEREDLSAAQVAFLDAGVADGGSARAPSADAAVRLTLTPLYTQRVPTGEFAFPSTARPSTDRSPGFRLVGVPAAAKSLAVTFRDLDNRAVKWVIWDLPPTLTELPAGISARSTRPAQLPGASQLGSQGKSGYAGPCCVERRYEFVLWALDVATLPGTRGRTTVELFEQLLPPHAIAKSEPVLLRIAQP